MWLRCNMWTQICIVYRLRPSATRDAPLPDLLPSAGRYWGKHADVGNAEEKERRREASESTRRQPLRPIIRMLNLRDIIVALHNRDM